VKPHDSEHQKKGERNNHKMVSEVYLTRLLTAKVGTLYVIRYRLIV